LLSRPFLIPLCPRPSTPQSGKRAGDEATGRAIAEALAAVPLVDAAAFERTFTAGLQNLLMVTYLANLTQAQVKLAEKIATQVPERRP
jgi:hypothetical protein